MHGVNKVFERMKTFTLIMIKNCEGAGRDGPYNLWGMVQSCPGRNLLANQFEPCHFDFWPTSTILSLKLLVVSVRFHISVSSRCMVTNPYLSKFQKFFSPTESEAPIYTEIRLLPNCRLFADMYDSCSVFPAFNMTLFRRNSAENQITLR